LERTDIQNDFIKMDNYIRFNGTIFCHDHSALHSRSCKIYYWLRREYMRDDIYVWVSAVCGAYKYYYL